MADGKVIIETGLDNSGLEKGLNQLSGKLKTGTVKAAKAAATAIAGVAAAMGAAGAASITAGASFEEGMSKVAAIAGASDAELEQLTAKAKQMGIQTKFSATESAEALQYMAQAGWKTTDMLNGIEGVMNLAAASGEDLGRVSDIVTDSLTAFGLAASDSAHFADVLAQAAAASNTDVSKMGETFKYAAPIAGTLKYSIEDTAVAIGLMANAGIKGEQAGTSLRAMLTRLVKPPKDAANALDALGVSASNADGSMKPLSQLMNELREKFNGLSDSQKTQYAAAIAGQEAMSGFLAIINASQSDFDSLTAQINNADGAAKTMAETMQNNLTGQVTILKSSLEGLGIAIYDSVKAPLTDTVKTAIGYVNEITNAFNNGGMTTAILKTGDLFAEVATKAAESAPQMIDSAILFIQSFVSGIADNSDRLVSAAGQIASTLANGLAQLLPYQIRKPVQDAIQEITKSFKSGGLNQAIDTVSLTFKNLSTVVGKVAKVALPPLTKAIDLFGKSLKIVIPLAVAYITAMKTYSAITAITAIINSATKAVQLATAADIAGMAALTLKQVAVGVLTGQITLATAAQWAWNTAMNANPIGLIITAVAALTAGVAALALTTQDQTTAADLAAEAQSNYGEACTNAMSQMTEYRNAIDSAKSMFDDFNDSLIVNKDEQQQLADQMDAVQTEITTIAKNASDRRSGYTQSEIDRLNELFAKMHELAQKELEMAQSYQTAAQSSAEALANNADLTAKEYAEQAQSIIKGAEEKKQAVIDAANAQYNEEFYLAEQAYGKNGALNKAAYDEAVKTAEQNKQAAVDSAYQIASQTYAILENGYKNRSSALQEYTNTFSELHQQQLDTTAQYNADMERLWDEYNSTADPEKRKTILAQIVKTQDDYSTKMNDLYKDQSDALLAYSSEDLGTLLTYAQGVAAAGGQISQDTALLLNEMANGYDKLDDNTKKQFDNLIKTLDLEVNTINGREVLVYASGSRAGQAFLDGWNSEDLEGNVQKSGEDIVKAIQEFEGNLNEENKKLKAAGVDVSGTLATAILSKNDNVQKAFTELWNSMKNGTQANFEQLSTMFSQIGVSLPDTLIQSLATQAPNVQMGSIDLISQLAAGVELKSGEIETLLSNFGIDAGDELITALEEQTPDVQLNAVNLLNQLQTADESTKPAILAALNSLGTSSGEQLGAAIAGQYGYVYDEATGTFKAVEDSGNNNSDSVNSSVRGKGESAGQSYADGVRSKEGETESAAGTLLDAITGKLDSENIDSYSWGDHLVSNFVRGLQNGQSALVAGVTSIAGVISDYLHHTTPEIGPLADDDQWTPDMMDNFADGIVKNTPKVVDSLNKMAQSMSDKVHVTPSMDFEGLNSELAEQLANMPLNNVEKLVNSARSATIAQKAQLSAVIATSSTQNIINQLDLLGLMEAVERGCKKGCENAELQIDGTLETKLNVDGHTMATAVYPYINSEMERDFIKQQRGG